MLNDLRCPNESCNNTANFQAEVRASVVLGSGEPEFEVQGFLSDVTCDDCGYSGPAEWFKA